jgi:hypothetical protein
MFRRKPASADAQLDYLAQPWCALTLLRHLTELAEPRAWAQVPEDQREQLLQALRELRAGAGRSRRGGRGVPLSCGGWRGSGGV